MSRRSRRIKEYVPRILPPTPPCPLCGRSMVEGPSLNDHHLIPKSQGGIEKFRIHRDCHSKIHSVLSEVELALVYNTFEKLREHAAIRKFISWVRKQSPEKINKHRRMRRPAGRELNAD